MDPAVSQIITVFIGEMVMMPILVFLIKRFIGSKLDDFDEKRDEARKERNDRLRHEQMWQEAVSAGLQTILRSEIVSEYRKAKDKGYASLETKEYLERVHHVYAVDLGGNSLGTSMYEYVLSMPTEPPEDDTKHH